MTWCYWKEKKRSVENCDSSKRNWFGNKWNKKPVYETCKELGNEWLDWIELFLRKYKQITIYILRNLSCYLIDKIAIRRSETNRTDKSYQSSSMENINRVILNKK